MHKSDKIETLKLIFRSRGSEVRILSPRLVGNDKMTNIKPFFIEGLLFYQTVSINIIISSKRDTNLRDTVRDTTL